jgi:flagellar biosynthesis protein FlhF
MRVKRYVADSLQEAIARVKADLGRNAIILHTKQFKEGGVWGFFAQRRFEVIAALDENPSLVLEKKAPPEVQKPEKSEGPAGFTPLFDSPQITTPSSRLVRSAPVPAQPELNPASGLPPLTGTSPPQVKLESTAATGSAFASLRAEMAEMKELIRKVATAPPQVVMKMAKETDGPGSKLRARLELLGLDAKVAQELLAEIPQEILVSVNSAEQLNYCQQLLAAKLMFSEPLETGMQSKQQVIALIGPTGVGKTTTIAKLAANFNLFERKKVGLVTIDTYRIAAVEHLKTYGDIMNLPVEVVYAATDLEPAVANLRDCDVVLVDTAGRSPRNQMMMDELRDFIAKPIIETILLVISATTQLQDMLNIEEKFARIAYTHLAFTKLDETSCLGPLVSLAWRCKRPISYLATGQNVPDDLEAAKPDKLIEQLFKGLANG